MKIWLARKEIIEKRAQELENLPRDEAWVEASDELYALSSGLSRSISEYRHAGDLTFWPSDLGKIESDGTSRTTKIRREVQDERDRFYQEIGLIN